ncbi:3-dehydroshikimate dehydratase [Gemmata obscuriglobus]|uniref:Sugar phosphate isomerase/epimerase n=1 Tax=Gemmata obscuriglobus TaxID=114 RepID=A0A2Z3H4Y1_9BACT|nr:sugar phosphate isomerase/epimerase family protein [Gemmata obscuriglobus]AWM39382.1 sugar phosphate isomerase/epimerase [Gemmata obscuriglobus]QEG27546.1 3-dehydroshikimate dehydratase [Gemmata obscuriglobus]VTS04611.1 Xylose isomerase domain-containing protein TIM barrel OS=Isosphaera pallida (strain ATCC 43644 / DSM 9630 / IS1B) GN=Isop_2191 PE=4 SV=1: AP_endonuc_2 [Gemmata obscuriglobus UQM 2246]
MFTLSAFADEISHDPREQIAVLKACRIRFIEFRSIYKTNVLGLTDDQIKEFKKLLDGEGMGLSAIGSPVGKVAIDAPFEPHLDRLKRAIELCHVFGTPGIRVFSYYPPGNDPKFDPANWPAHRDEVIRRMGVKAELAAKGGVVLYHENEHRIFGDSPDRVADILSTVNHPALRGAYDAANYAYGNFDPVEGWEKTKAWTAHLHIKDWKMGGHAAGHDYGVIPGTGDGQIAHSVRDAAARGYKGFAVMEPHLRGGGPTGGITGPDLFPYAVQAFRTILDEAWAKYD